MLNFKNYTLKQYKLDIDTYGLSVLWHSLIDYCRFNGNIGDDFDVDNFGELYEYGLAYYNRTDKKENGKYYTPMDVAHVMAEWLIKLEGINICDVCCGTGNLILAYLDIVGMDEARKLVNSGHVYLYDMDSVALDICKFLIGYKYGYQEVENIHCVVGDFLDKGIVLPENSKVISNPPYCKISEIKERYNKTDVLLSSKELYAAIMEKIMDSSNSSVIITPYSFIGGTKFYDLRKKMNNYNGFIVSFDNVPGNIFSGRKLGVFNSNLVNSVRAAITVVENKGEDKGFRCSSLIRFKNEQRSSLLDIQVLEQFIGTKYQTVSLMNTKYVKCSSDLENIFKIWIEKSNKTLDSLIDDNGEYVIYVPNTCRYFTVGAVKNLDRSGKIELRFSDERVFTYVYCLINSSFCYWHWRLYDGGINYASLLLRQLPVFYDSVSSIEIKELEDISKHMIDREVEYLTYKQNAGKIQENVKFPYEYRRYINQILFNILDISDNPLILDQLHCNHVQIGGHIRSE